MAKITARGARPVARWEREDETPDSTLTLRVKRVLLLRSDNVLLERHTSWFRPSSSWEPPSGRRHDAGWSVRSRKPKSLEGLRQILLTAGWREV